MYQKPQLERFGSFRELTLVGFQGGSDGMTVAGVIGSNCVSGSVNPDGSGNFLGCNGPSRS